MVPASKSCSSVHQEVRFRKRAHHLDEGLHLGVVFEAVAQDLALEFVAAFAEELREKNRGDQGAGQEHEEGGGKGIGGELSRGQF